MPYESSFRRRHLLILGAALVVSACANQAAEDVAAFASRGGERFEFRDTVGWLELNGRIAVVAFFQRMLTPAERQAVVAQRGVFPSIEPHEPMIEMRFFLRDKEKRIEKDNLEAVQLTFWHFAAPAPVLKFGPEVFDGPDVSFVGLDGESRAGGWAVGTVRGQGVVTVLGGRDVSHTWNLTFQASLQ